MLCSYILQQNIIKRNFILCLHILAYRDDDDYDDMTRLYMLVRDDFIYDPKQVSLSELMKNNALSFLGSADV